MTKIPAADAFESRKTMELTPFAFTFADTALRNQKAGFELQFNLLQNALIGRHNEKIEEITTTSTTLARRIDDLSERQQSLLDSIPALQEFRQGNLNNAGALEKVFDEITVLFETFNTDATVDAAEVAAFQAQRDLLADRMERLYVFSHPDINDAQVVKRLKEDIDSIRALEVTAGALTDAGNVAVSDALSALQTEVSVAITVSQQTASTTLGVEQRIQSQFATVESELIELTAEEKVRREEEIAAAETDLGNLLRAISISFEITSGLSEALSSRLKPLTPPPGSAVNIIS